MSTGTHAATGSSKNRWIVAGLTLIAAVLAIAAFVVFGTGDSDSPTTPVAAPSATATSSAPATKSPSGDGFVPTSLKIPSIGVDTSIESLGMAADRSQAVPESLSTVAWYNLGPKVGAAGSAAMTGHTASKGDGVFDDLGSVAVGDTITVLGKDGDEQKFEVRSKRTVPVADFATYAPSIYSKEGPSRLTLMTCGDYNGSDFTTTIIVWATAV